VGPGGALAKRSNITLEGTIEGLLSTCSGKACAPGEEYIIAALEDTYVLVSDSGKYYFLPNLKASQLSRYLGKHVRGQGTLALDGDAIIVKTADAMIEGKWKAFSSREIMDRARSCEARPINFSRPKRARNPQSPSPARVCWKMDCHTLFLFSFSPSEVGFSTVSLENSPPNRSLGCRVSCISCSVDESLFEIHG